MPQPLSRITNKLRAATLDDNNAGSVNQTTTFLPVLTTDAGVPPPRQRRFGSQAAAANLNRHEMLLNSRQLWHARAGWYWPSGAGCLRRELDRMRCKMRNPGSRQRQQSAADSVRFRQTSFFAVITDKTVSTKMDGYPAGLRHAELMFRAALCSDYAVSWLSTFVATSPPAAGNRIANPSTARNR